MESEKFCLKWNEFQANNAASFQELRESNEFTDVTLVCEDNQRFEAHRVILSSASNFFKSVLTENKHSHPLIYMRRMKTKYFEPILDFIYNGETEVSQKDINDFLLLAEELEMKGLTSDPNETENNDTKIDKYDKAKNKRKKIMTTNDLVPEPDVIKEEISPTSEYDMKDIVNGSLVTDAKVSGSVQDDNTELIEIINSMLENVEGIWTCKKCGKTDKLNHSGKVKRHIETHIEGMAHPCDFCGKTFRYIKF